MQQYFYSDRLQTGDRFQLNQDDMHHIINVMRLKSQEIIHVVDSERQTYRCQLQALPEKEWELETLDQVYFERELPVKVIVACGLSKNDKLDWIVQKATETGMMEFIPLVLRRDVVKWEPKKAQKRVERLQKIAKEAAQQSKREIIPYVHNLMTLQEMTKMIQADHRWVMYEDTAKSGQHGALKTAFESVKSTDSIIAVFGSEGGFDPSEIQYLNEQNYLSCSLGPRILRAETAPIYLLSALSYQLEL